MRKKALLFATIFTMCFATLTGCANSKSTEEKQAEQVTNQEDSENDNSENKKTKNDNTKTQAMTEDEEAHQFLNEVAEKLIDKDVSVLDHYSQKMLELRDESVRDKKNNLEEEFMWGARYQKYEVDKNDPKDFAYGVGNVNKFWTLKLQATDQYRRKYTEELAAYKEDGEWVFFFGKDINDSFGDYTYRIFDYLEYQEGKEPKQYEEKGEIEGVCEFEILRTESYEDEIFKILAIHYRWKNLGKEETSPSENLNWTLSQDGVVLREYDHIFSDVDVYDSDKKSLTYHDVLPGSEVEAVVYYEYLNDSDVEINVSVEGSKDTIHATAQIP